MKKKICVVSSTRADYGILKPLLVKLKRRRDWKTQLVMTGSHLEERLGYTYREAEEDGIEIFSKLPINTKENSCYDTSLIMSNALVKFGQYFQDEKPDLLIVLGDRTEIMAICAAAVNAHIPIAHLHGGELTLGAVDDCMRHAITKMSYIHLAATEEYRRRIIQMGEEPERVFHVGALWVENILKEELLSCEELGADVGFPSMQHYAVVTFHPVTLEKGTAESQAKELFAAMREKSDIFFLITKANADAGGEAINRFMEKETLRYPNMKVVASLGRKRYLSAVKYAKFVLGNSSSGMTEVSLLGVPTVNIGDRQRGRIVAESVISCEPNCRSILDAIGQALRWESAEYKGTSLYGNGNTSELIIEILDRFLCKEEIDLKKKFFDIAFQV